MALDSITHDDITITLDEFTTFCDMKEMFPPEDMGFNEIAKYELSEVFPEIDKNNPRKKDVYVKLIEHMYSFITKNERYYDKDLLFGFGLEEIDNETYKSIDKDIKVTWDGTFDFVSTNSLFHYIEDQVGEMFEEDDDEEEEEEEKNENNFKLVIQVHDLFIKPDETYEPYEIYNKNKTFKQEECCICMANKPNILFCNCGHICICEEFFTGSGKEVPSM